MNSIAPLPTFTLAVVFITLSTAAIAADQSWKNNQIADALSAAPPTVTADARLYSWNKNRQLVMLRNGDGAYSCVASGHSSIRLGKPALPFPDPMCLDQNAWNFFLAAWNQKTPTKPNRPYPSAPGLVWMLAGMGVAQGMVSIDSSKAGEFAVAKSGQKITRLPPHLMITPLPINKQRAELAGSYNPKKPLASWVMFKNTPLEHLMMHISEQTVAALMQADPDKKIALQQLGRQASEQAGRRF